jgi:hypothetical protein
VKPALEKQVEHFPGAVNPLWEIVLSPVKGVFPKVLPLRKVGSDLVSQIVFLLKAAQEMAGSVEAI